MPDTPDHFARKSVARVWTETRTLAAELDGVLSRLAAIEPKAIRHLRRCTYCGEWTLGVACRNCEDLLEVDNLAPTQETAA